MGKTWTLQEVARRLIEEGNHLVGYYESKAAESSHLLYTVSNLYANWLSDSSLRQQALSLWERHKEGLVPRIGQMVGLLFEKLAGKTFVAEGIAAVVRTTFDGLAEAQKDLSSGGIQLAPLAYDQALSLTSLVAEVSGRGVVLILDAWEKSPSARFEYATLEAFLKHLDEWPNTHAFLAIRNPELGSTDGHDGAYRRAQDLVRISPAALMYELPPLELEGEKERQRIISYLREHVPAAGGVDEKQLLDMIDGFAGVVSFWLNEATQTALKTTDDLHKEASNAHQLRYLELGHLLGGLTGNARVLAGRLAFFPRLDAERWTTFRQILVGDLSDSVVDELVDQRVLEDTNHPTYGHDTRHAAARAWFVQSQRRLIGQIAEYVVESLACRITGINIGSLPFFETLAACFEAAQQVQISANARCLVDAARAVLDREAILSPAFEATYSKVVQSNQLFGPLIVVSLINRGVTKGELGDSAGEMADYKAVIELPSAAPDQVAMALFNRGVAKGKLGDSAGAIADYTAVTELASAPVDDVARALYNRGVRKGQLNDSAGAMADYTAVIELLNAPAEQVAKALYNRGVSKGKLGDSVGEMADYTAVIELPNAPANQMARALYNRAITKAQLEDGAAAMADYTAVIELPNAPADQVAKALYNRGVRKGQLGDSVGEMADYTAVIELPNAPAEQVAKALYNRGVRKGQLGDSVGEMADYTAVIALQNAPIEIVESVKRRLAS